MELADYLRVLRRRWWLVVLAVLVGMAGAAAATALQTPKYQTSTRLLVSGTSSTSAIDEISRRQLANQRAVAYAQIATTGPAVEAAVTEAGADGASPQVTATATGDDPFIVVTVTATDPQVAQDVANAYVTTLPTTITDLDRVPSATPPSLSVLEPAGLPSEPFSPNPTRNLIVGAVLGLLLGVAAALIRESLDVRIRDSGDVERMTGVTLLGVVPKEFTREKLPAVTRPHSRRAEAYRQVRTNLEFTTPTGRHPSIAVTSAGQGEGKSSLATNLAIIVGRAGRSVVVVDADLRKPMVASYLGVTPERGLTDVLTGRCTLEEALVVVPGERVVALASGPVPDIPSELVGSAAMVELVEELERRFDLVIIDTPPALLVTDALLVGVNVGGVVIVSRMGEVTRSGLRRAVAAVEKVHGKVLGIVANAATEPEDKAYGYGYQSGYLKEDATGAGAGEVPIQAADRRVNGTPRDEPVVDVAKVIDVTTPRAGRHAGRPRDESPAPAGFPGEAPPAL